MSVVFRNHMSHSRAHILVGVLASGGIPALVVGDLAAHLYGGLVLDCAVLVSEELVEDAEELLQSDFAEEEPDNTLPAEQGPPNGDPPSIGAIFFVLLPFALGMFGVRIGLVMLSIMATRISSIGYLEIALRTLIQKELPWVLAGVLVHAVGAGLLLGIIRGYRHGSRPCRVVVKALRVLLIFS